MVLQDSVPTFSLYMAPPGDETDTVLSRQLAPGESGLVRLDIASVTEISQLTVTVRLPTNLATPLALCAMNLVHSGANLPCLHRAMAPGALNSRWVLTGALGPGSKAPTQPHCLQASGLAQLLVTL